MVKGVPGDEVTRATWRVRSASVTGTEIDRGTGRARRAAYYDARFLQARNRALADLQRAAPQPPALPVAVERPVTASRRRRNDNWPAWIVASVGSAALVSAGYLGALVQLGAGKAQAPHPIHLTPAPVSQNPASSAIPTAVRVDTVIGEPIRVVATARRPKAHRVDTRAAALATAELERELYDREAPVLTIRTLPKPEAAPAGRVQPSRADVQQALLAMRPRLEACAAGRRGMIDARVGIAGTGRVTSALIQGAFAGTPEGSCMARALRAATVQPFSGPVFQVQFPFAL